MAKKFNFDGISVEAPTFVNVDEARAYLRLADEEAREAGERVVALTVTELPDGKIDLDATWRPPQFQRIRRITGRVLAEQVA